MLIQIVVILDVVSLVSVFVALDMQTEDIVDGIDVIMKCLVSHFLMVVIETGMKPFTHEVFLRPMSGLDSINQPNISFEQCSCFAHIEYLSIVDAKIMRANVIL